MKRIDFYQYAKEVIKESMNSFIDSRFALYIFGNPAKYTIGYCFSDNIRNGKLYANCIGGDNLIGKVDDLREEFEEARKDALAEYLAGLAAHEDWRVREIAACHRNTPAEALATLTADKISGVRRFAASNPNTPAEALATLANDKDSSVRRFAACNPNAPLDVLAKLAKDEDWDVCRSSAENLAGTY